MEKKRFGSFDEKFQLLANILPMLVSVTKNPDDETEEQFIATHDRFITLGDITKDKLAAIKTADIIQNIGKVYNLSLVQMSDIARAIRSYYFNSLKLDDFPFMLAKEMDIDITKARQIFQIIKEKIIDDTSYEKALQATLASLPLSEALRIYPEMGEQLITSQKINLHSFPYPVRPSIKNWLADYTSILGYEKHEAMARSQYLFQGANAKNLSAPEKNRLAYVLKAFDENSPITVNKNTRQVIFPAITPAGKLANNTASATSADRPADNKINPPKTPSVQTHLVTPSLVEQKNINSMQFSYSQKMPYEKTLSSEIPDGSRGTERISRGEPQKMPTEKKEVEHAAWGQPSFWKVPDKKTSTPPIPTKNIPQNTPISPREIPAESRGAERISLGKPSPWRLPGKPSAPQSPPKNVVDLKNIQE